MTELPDNAELWETLHSQGELEASFSDQPSRFATSVLPFIPANARILELGCGLGQDAAFFARSGYDVLATDVARNALILTRQRYINQPRLTFLRLHTEQDMPFPNASFDMVYARLSLHYFRDEETRAIFREIHRVLKPGGLLAFMCRSVADPRYGEGEFVEPNVFLRSHGHICHFFSAAYVQRCLFFSFAVRRMEERPEELYGKASAYISVLAHKRQLDDHVKSWEPESQRFRKPEALKAGDPDVQKAGEPIEPPIATSEAQTAPASATQTDLDAQRDEALDDLLA